MGSYKKKPTTSGGVLVAEEADGLRVEWELLGVLVEEELDGPAWRPMGLSNYLDPKSRLKNNLLGCF